jgi:peptide/nickel transport system substrate-binding protein
MKLGPSSSAAFAVGAIVLALAAGGVLAGCGTGSKSSTGSSPASQNASLSVRMTADYDTLDPFRLIAVASVGLDTATYDRMVWADASGRILPYLAKSWTVTPTRIAMQVRTDVRCADGTRLTPADMAASLRRFVSPTVTPPTRGVYLGPGPFTVTSSADTVTLSTKTPTDMLPGLSQVLIVCPAGLRDEASLANKPAGSGPYVLVHAVRGESYTLKRRSDWTWGPQGASKALPRTLVYKVVTNDSTAANLLTSGGLDVAEVEGPDARRVTGDGSLTLHPARDFGMTFLQFNEAPGHATTDLAVRRALSSATDRNAWNKASGIGNGHPSTSMYPQNMQCYDASTASVAPAYSPALARAELEKAGYVPGAGGTLTKAGKPLTIRVLGWESNLLGPDYVAAALQKIGVKATLQKVDIGTQIETEQKGDFDINIIDSRFAAPVKTGSIGFLLGPGGKQGLNFGSAQNREAEHWVAVASRKVGDAACPAWGNVQKAFAKEADAQPLMSETYSWFARKGIGFDAVGSVLTPWSIKAG